MIKHMSKTNSSDQISTEHRRKEISDVQNHRWCIYIDILGFSKLWESGLQEALKPLNELMRAISRIGIKVYPEPGDRLFVHHMGDGFAIVSDFHESSLERPVSIATALMRCVAATGNFALAAIAEGEFSDIRRCYPEEVRHHSDNGTIRLGNGIMTLSSVMGTAFIRAYQLHKKIPSGPFLIMSECHRSRVPPTLSVKTVQGNILSINWIESQTPLLTKIQDQAGLPNPRPCELMQKIQDHCTQYPHIGKKWNTQLCDFLNLNTAT